MSGIIVIFFLIFKKLSLHMDRISEHINSSIQKIYSYDQMRKMIFNLGNKKCKNNNNSTCQLISLQNSLLMCIFVTTKKDYQRLIGNQT